jgi:uncharacterized protein
MDFINYTKLIDEAMLGLVKKAMADVLENGFRGEHHFFITFVTTHKDTEITTDLLDKFPREMTIVLQHQYWDMDVNDKGFEVVLSFDSIRHKLCVGWDSIISFVDPSCKFGVQFNTEDDAAAPAPEPKKKKDNVSPIKKESGKVVQVDFGRKD